MSTEVSTEAMLVDRTLLDLLRQVAQPEPEAL